MANSKLEHLKAELAKNPNAPAIIEIGSDTEGLSPAELAVILNAPWPDDSSTWVTMYVNYSRGINVRSAPSPTASIVGSLNDNDPVQVDPTQIQNGYVPVGPDGKTFVLASLLSAQPDKPTVLIDVPYRSQWANGAKKYVNDCGPDCVGMLLDKYLPGNGISTDQLASETSLAQRDTGLPTADLVNLATRHGLKLILRNDATWNQVKAQLDAGLPVIALIVYGPLLQRWDQHDVTGLHFVLVVGYSAKSVWLSDPDWLDSSGHNWRVPLDQWNKAVAQCQPPYQAAFISTVSVPPVSDTRPIGFDVYHGNDVDILKLAADGAFVFHKVSQGTHFTDPAQASRYNQVRAARVPLFWGGTHFATNGSVSDQLSRYTSSLVPGSRVVPVLDVEHSDDAEGDASLTTVGILASAIKTELGQYPLIYTRANYWDNLVAASPGATGAVEILKNCELWVASGHEPPVLPDFWTTWRFQQFDQTIPTGLLTTVDTDRFNGTAQELSAWWSAHSITVPQPPPIVAPRSRFGIHISPYAYQQEIVVIAQHLHDIGKPLACVRVVSDSDLANRLAPYTTVVFRAVFGDGHELFDPSRLTDQAAAIQYGRDFYNGPHSEPNAAAASAHYLQFTCEVGYHPLDWAFALGLMYEAEAHGRKVALFGDSEGTPEIEQWKTRVSALTYAQTHGHIVALNEYGRWVDGKPANIEVSDPVGIESYGLRHRAFYAAVPETARPTLIITETGPADAHFMGIDRTVADMKAYNGLLQPDEYVKGYCYWGFGGSLKSVEDANAALPAIEALVASS